jgi:hypothetical protein
MTNSVGSTVTAGTRFRAPQDTTSFANRRLDAPASGRRRRLDHALGWHPAQPGRTQEAELMIDDEQHDAPVSAPPAGAATAGDDVLAVAEEAAAREAHEEAREEAAAHGAKVVKPKATTSRKAPAAGSIRRAASAPVSLAMARTQAISGEVVDGVPSDVAVHDRSVAEVNATNVDITRSGVGRIRATDVAVSQGGIGLAQGDRVSVEMGGIGAAIAGELRVSQGGVGSVLARDVHVEQAVVRTVVANNVHFDRTTGVLVLLARRVDGNVRAVLDWRAALAFGAAFGIVTSIFRRRR